MTVPPEALDAAAAAVAARFTAEHGCAPDPEEAILIARLAASALAAAQPLIAAAERDRIYAELGSDHYVIYTEDRWTIEHSVECRRSGRMHECAYHEAIAAVSDEYEPAMAGRWRIVNIDTEGVPVLEQVEDAP